MAIVKTLSLLQVQHEILRRTGSNLYKKTTSGIKSIARDTTSNLQIEYTQVARNGYKEI